MLGLDKADGIGGIGDLSPKLVAVLLLAWLIVFFALKKGVKSSGKVRLVFCNTVPVHDLKMLTYSFILFSF